MLITASRFHRSCELSPGESGEAQALVLLEELRRAFGLPGEALADFRLAVVEACLNALEHGAPPVQVMVTGQRQGSELRVVVEVVDHGPGFEPETVPRPELPAKLASPRKRGWGLEIMRRLADRVTVSSHPGQTRVKLVRVLRG